LKFNEIPDYEYLRKILKEIPYSENVSYTSPQSLDCIPESSFVMKKD